MSVTYKQRMHACVHADLISPPTPKHTPPVRTKQSSKLNASRLQSMLNRGIGSKFGPRRNSLDSVSSEGSSSTGNTVPTRSSNGTTTNDDDDDSSKECVSSVVVLGDGCFLTGTSMFPSSKPGVWFYLLYGQLQRLTGRFVCGECRKVTILRT